VQDGEAALSHTLIATLAASLNEAASCVALLTTLSPCATPRKKRQRARVAIRIDYTLRLSAADKLVNRRFLAGEELADRTGDQIAGGGAFQRRVGIKTSPGIARIAHTAKQGLEHPLDATAGFRIRKSFEQRLYHYFFVACERGEEKLPLATKRCVEAGAIYPCRVHQVLDRSRFVPAFPKHTHRALEHLITIKLLNRRHFKSITMTWGATCQAERRSSRREAVQLLLGSNPNTLVFTATIRSMMARIWTIAKSRPKT